MSNKTINYEKSNSLSLSKRVKNSFSSNNNPNSRTTNAFTIVELLVVIVVIGILAAITIVSYTGISNKASVSSLQSDLSNAKKQLALYYVDHGAYPTSIDPNSKCPTGSAPTPDTRYCLKPSAANTFNYYPASSTYSTYLLTANKTGTSSIYSVTNDSIPAIMPTVTIGSQTWMQNNLNVGAMVTGVTAQTNNTTFEKYCYSDTESNCTTYGGLYQWDEAMQYVITAGFQGICPAGFHIPTDAEYKTLEMSLGMSQATADTTGWRGTTEGTQLKPGGTSGFNGLLAGYRNTAGSFVSLSSSAYLWSSSESSSSAWYRYLGSGNAPVYRSTDAKGYGFSVRCLGN
jgi:uncharacterized protein (TIGR02145 family)/prepilin-type N-terminal cleavage/methylation domain-containing protein